MNLKESINNKSLYGSSAFSNVNFFIYIFDFEIISQLHFFFSGLQSTCKTIGKKVYNKSCVFPFKYHGVTYYNCIGIDFDDYWCPTEVDDMGNYIYDEENPYTYGVCGPSCPKGDCKTESGPAQNKSCVFPFKYNGIEHSKCIRDDRHAYWCPTSLDEEDNYGFCSSNCPKDVSVYMGDCQTDNGPCILPFQFEGVIHRTCINKWKGKSVDDFWCPTYLPISDDAYMYDASNQTSDTWGRCGVYCPSSRLGN